MLTFDGKPICASAVYGLKTDGVTLSGNGTAESPIGIVGNTLHRYERLLYSANPNVVSSTSAGTLLDAPNNYDEMIIGVGYFEKNNKTVSEKHYYQTGINNNNDYHFANFFTYSDTIFWQEGTLRIPASGGNWNTENPLRLRKPFNTTARFYTDTQNARRRNYVEIWGVKYL